MESDQHRENKESEKRVQKNDHGRKSRKRKKLSEVGCTSLRKEPVAKVTILPPRQKKTFSATTCSARSKFKMIMLKIVREESRKFRLHSCPLEDPLRSFGYSFDLSRCSAPIVSEFQEKHQQHSKQLSVWSGKFWSFLNRLDALYAPSHPQSDEVAFSWLFQTDQWSSHARREVLSCLPFDFFSSFYQKKGGGQVQIERPCCAICSPGEPVPVGTLVLKTCHKHFFCAECLFKSLSFAKVDFSPSAGNLHRKPCVLLFCFLCCRTETLRVRRENALLSFCLMLWMCEKLHRPGSLSGLPFESLSLSDLTRAHAAQQGVFLNKKWIDSLSLSSLQALLDESLYTTQCPACGTLCNNPLVDKSHTQCLVLSCQECKQNFCGWCHFLLGKDKGSDSYTETMVLLRHHHVKQCFQSLSPGSLYVQDHSRSVYEKGLKGFARFVITKRILNGRKDLQEQWKVVSSNKSMGWQYWCCLWCSKKNYNSSGTCIHCRHTVFPWFVRRLYSLLNLTK